MWHIFVSNSNFVFSGVSVQLCVSDFLGFHSAIRQAPPSALSVCTVWTCVIIVCKMLYQLQTIKPENFSVNCSLVSLGDGGSPCLAFREGRHTSGDPRPPALADRPSLAQWVGGVLAPSILMLIPPEVGPPPIPVSLCSNPRETSLNSPDCGAISYSFLFSFQPNENQTNIPLHQLNKSLLYSTPIDPMEWMGLRKSSPLLIYLRVRLPHP